MRLAGLAGGDLAPEMLEDVVMEMLALPGVSKAGINHVLGSILYSI